MAKPVSKASSRTKKPRAQTQPPRGLGAGAEPMLAGLFGNHLDDPAFAAQQLAYDMMDAIADGDEERALELAEQAVRLDPNCVDALHFIAGAVSESDDELIEHLEAVVERGEAALGKRFFREYQGCFWGIIETRPYMRARVELANTLASSGRREEAITHYEEMLRLNPNDNQGLRYLLIGHYLAIGWLDAARALFNEYPKEGSAMFVWARVLEQFLSKSESAAAKALQKARKQNPFVEPYLTDKKRKPKRMPEYYSYGDESEALVCLEEIGEAWRGHPPAVAWLKAHAKDTPARSAPRKRK